MTKIVLAAKTVSTMDMVSLRHDTSGSMDITEIGITTNAKNNRSYLLKSFKLITKSHASIVQPGVIPRGKHKQPY